MNSFFKIFFACLLAIFIFSLLSVFMFLGFVSGITKPEKVRTGGNAVLLLDLAQPYTDLAAEEPLANLAGGERYSTPGLYDVVRLIQHAKTDSAIKGIYLKCGYNPNGFAASDELRNALLEFKTSKKFVIGYADVITQSGYQVASVADKLYCNPKGGVDWRGYAFQLAFLKGTLKKLEIEPQIFYAGKFKSATEPFREEKMTDANRLQTTELMNDLYGHFLTQSAADRKTDTGRLHQLANDNLIRFAADAQQQGLVDGLKYDDEVRDEIRNRMKLGKTDKINFVAIGKYAKAVDFKQSGRERIALIIAQGDIIDGKGDRNVIGSETYRKLIREARFDKDIKAIVVRVNSGGGSSLASENIWRELVLAKKDKPVVVSFGNVAASGGYYLACHADSIFAEPNTITGSIGVFSMIPNMQQFFNNKLGITFDGVKTSPDADALSVTKPLTEMQKRFLQSDVDSIYHDFKTRVAEGRKLSMEFVDSIGQGRVWSGKRALQLKLVDRLGNLGDAIACAARMAKVSSYSLKEYPEPRNVLEMLFGDYQKDARNAALKEELGVEGMKVYNSMKRVKGMVGVTQARMPFDLVME